MTVVVSSASDAEEGSEFVRHFRNFLEAKNELTRDLNELGTTINAGYQSKQGEYETKELQDYDYRVTRPKIEDLDPTQPWARVEWDDRLNGIHGSVSNPGKAWSQRFELWEPLLESEGRFSYTYSERLFRSSTLQLVDRLKNNPNSRQIYISIWDPEIDPKRVGYRRVPCSLGYQLMIRNNALDISYHMRSSDFITHWDNDVWLALQLQRWAAHRIDVQPGSFTHKIGSFHAYTRDIAHAF